MTDDLIAFLRAQLDDDERVAREALKRQTSQRRMIRGQMVDVPNQPMPEWRRSVWPPERVLAEIEAKRRLLEPHAESDFPYDPDGPGPGDYSWTARCNECYQDAPCLTVRLLALPYAGRDGWREEWRA